ncbi:MAG: lipopolysaccharide core heptose(I) kinase RfaP [Gammaproteobacteria bacterium]|nr:lipopolysaccharide core heptose(I) kinase RfaP [Gammaproteobacteria bacterium]
MAELYLREDIAKLWPEEEACKRARALTGEVYRELDGRRTLRVMLGERAYFAKLHFGVGWREIVKNLVTARLPVTGARNEFRTCQHLQARGVSAPKVAAFGQVGGSPASRFSFVICDALEGYESLEDITERWELSPPSPHEKRRLIEAVADFAKALHRSGVIHRDFYVCHLFAEIEPYARGEVRLAVIDLHRAQIHTEIPQRWLLRDLAALLFSTLDLGLNSRAWFRFIRIYRGRPLQEVFAEEGEFWRNVYERALALYEKGERKGLVKGRFRR